MSMNMHKAILMATGNTQEHSRGRLCHTIYTHKAILMATSNTSTAMPMSIIIVA